MLAWNCWLNATRVALPCLGLWVGGTVLGGSMGLSQAVASERLNFGTNPPLVLAQTSLELFQPISIAPGFNPDPWRVQGISGGTEWAGTIADRLATETGLCLGYVGTEPDYQLTLTEGFDYLNLRIYGTVDTMLLVQGPGGTWCSDDGVGQDPSIGGQWLPGTYRVWVGSAQPEDYQSFVLELSEIQ